MHTQHVKFSTYLGSGGGDAIVDALIDSLPSSSSSSSGGTGDEPDAAAATAVVVVLVVVVVVVVAVVLFASFTPTASSLFFEEREVARLVVVVEEEEDDRSVFEVAVDVSFLPSPPFFLLLLDFIGTIQTAWSFFLFENRLKTMKRVKEFWLPSF
jgi:hypothetical protein